MADRSSIHVWVNRFPDRPVFQLQWVDPISGRTKTKSSGVRDTGKARDRTLAQEKARELERQLQSNSGELPSEMTWEAFRRKYLSEHAAGLARQTVRRIQLVCDAFERESSPRKLFDVTADRLSHFVARMRERGASEATIKSYLAQLKAMLNWGKRLGLLEKCPLMPQLPRAKASSGNSPVKGRPLVAEEFERMLAATAEVVGEAHAPIWQRYLRGLWVSGLRLEESLQLYWDRSDKLHPILPPPGQGRPHLRILAELEKGNQDRLLPISPDFALFLMETPPAKRRGPVFRLPHRTRKGCWLGSQQVGKTVSAIGKRAGVKVLEAAKTARVKFASAHDLRRSFGDRWARKLMPADLKEMMRHSSIETTLRYYVGRNADRTADLCWETTPAAEAAYAAHFGGSHNSSHNIDPFQRVA